MNIYILYCLYAKVEHLKDVLNSKYGINAYIPQIEEYSRFLHKNVIKPIYPNYLFIETNMNQEEFDVFLSSLHEDKSGVVKQLKKEDVSALREVEKELFQKLFNKKHILEMSIGYIGEDGKVKIETGPLKEFEKDIVYINKRIRIAYLDLQFLKKDIKAGLYIKNENKEI